MTNPDDLLVQLRALAYVMPQAYPRANSAARLLADTFDKLDAHLTAGGAPPEAWREGPDAPADDPYCAAHGARFDPTVGCPGCLCEVPMQRDIFGPVTEHEPFPGCDGGPSCPNRDDRTHADVGIYVCDADGCDQPPVGETVDGVLYCSRHVPMHGDGRE